MKSINLITAYNESLSTSCNRYKYVTVYLMNCCVQCQAASCVDGAGEEKADVHSVYICGIDMCVSAFIQTNLVQKTMFLMSASYIWLVG